MDRATEELNEFWTAIGVQVWDLKQANLHT